MLSKILSFTLHGLNGYIVEVEADLNNGLPFYETVGLPDAAVKESRERVRAAIKNSGYNYPMVRTIVSLAPANLKKEGALYDLPIALALLTASGQITPSEIDKYIVIGELSLDGTIRHVNGVLPIIISAREQGFTNFIIPKANAKEASYISNINAYACESLADAVNHLCGENILQPALQHEFKTVATLQGGNDFANVKGQYSAKRALEIAVSGGHNVLMIGPPGAGKTMIAKCVTSIMPDLTLEEALEITKIHSIAGTLNAEDGIVLRRPFRSPHHTATTVALTGGGKNIRPGEISLAHGGVLFLDEMPEYSRQTLETLRQPIEDGVITIARAASSVTYPASFMMIASMNPCPCGHYGSKTQVCTCSPTAISKYLSKISGPLLDRIDMHIEVAGVTYSQLREEKSQTTSDIIKARVNQARQIQQSRFKGSKVYCNAQMDANMLNDYCAINSQAQNILKTAFEVYNLSARSHNRILKVARTIADLDGMESISEKHVAEAIQYRMQDRKYFVNS